LPWSRAYRIRWFWVDPARYRQQFFWATSEEMFRKPVDTRFLMFADADVIFVKDFSELFRRIEARPTIAGVMAHVPPVPVRQTAGFWEKMFGEYGLGLPPQHYHHSITQYRPQLEKIRLWPKVPAYFNFGMVLGTQREMAAVCGNILGARSFVEKRIDTFYHDQIALTLTMYKHGIEPWIVPLRFNFPNDPRFDEAYPQELAEIRALHYLRTAIVDRDRDFERLDSVEKLIRRADLEGSNEVLRRTLATLYCQVAAGEALITEHMEAVHGLRTT
jgi:hypothetical protein